MSLEAWGGGDDDDGRGFSDERVAEIAQASFIRGVEICREMMARFVEQGGDTSTAQSIRANWNPIWGADPGLLDRDVYQVAQENGFDCWTVA